MKSNRKLAWELYNTQDSLNSKQMKDIVDSLPCDQGIKTTIYESILLSENYVIDKLEEEVVPLMYLEEMAKDLDIKNDNKFQTGGSYKTKMNSAVVKNFFNKHLRVELDDKSINDIIEAEIEISDSRENEYYDIDIDKAREEIDFIVQKGGDDDNKKEHESLWMCPECKFPSNSSEKLMCIKCESLNPNPPKDDFQKWKETYPNTVKLVSKSMAGFLFVFKRIITQLKENSSGKINDENMGYINNLMLSMEPDNILKMIYKRGVQLKEIFIACKDFITNFMIKSFVKIKEIIFWVFDNIIHIFNFTKEKIETFLYPKTYLNDKDRINKILNSIDINKNPEIYNIHTSLDDIMQVDIEFLERSIDKWLERGPDTPIRSAVLNIINATGDTIINVSAMALHYLGITASEDSLNSDQKALIELRQTQERMVYEYLTKLYNYLITSNFFIENGPDISRKSTTVKYRMTIYFFNILLIFRRRWRFGFRREDIRIFDGKKAFDKSESEMPSFMVDEEVYVTNIEFTLRYPEFIKGKEGIIFSSKDHHSIQTKTFTSSNNVFRGVVKHRVLGGMPGIVSGPDTKMCYGDSLNIADPCRLTDYYVEFKIPLKSIDRNIIEQMVRFLTTNKVGTETESQYRSKIQSTLESMATHTDELGEKYILVNSGAPDRVEYTPSDSTYDDLDLGPEIIFHSLFQGNDSGLERMITGDFTRNNKLCYDDPDAGKIPYPDTGVCPYEEDSPPIKSGKDWIKWTQSENALKFINEQLPESLFIKELIEYDTMEDVPRNCSKLDIRYDDKFTDIGYKVTVKNVNAIPNSELGSSTSDLLNLSDPRFSGHLLTGQNLEARVTNIFLSEDEGKTFKDISILGKTVEDISKLSKEEYSKNVKYIVQFSIDVDELIYDNISYKQEYILDNDEDYSGYINYKQFVFSDNFQSIDENYTDYEMKQVIYSYLCENKSDIEKLNLNILKSILLMDYESISKSTLR